MTLLLTEILARKKPKIGRYPKHVFNTNVLYFVINSFGAGLFYDLLYFVLAVFAEPQPHLKSKLARLIVLNQMPRLFNDDQMLRLQCRLQLLSRLDRYPSIILPPNDVGW